MNSASVTHFLWSAELIFQGLLALVLLQKKMWKSFPFFTTYALFDFAQTLAGWMTYSHYDLYFVVYWASQVIGLILSFAVVYEVFKNLFRPYPALRRLARLSFQWTAVVLVLLGCAIIYFHSSPAQRYPLLSAFLVVEQATRIVEIGMLMLLFLFSTGFDLHWRRSVFGMAFGFGVLVAVQLTAVTVVARLWEMANVVLMFASNLSLLIWLGYFLAPETVTRPAELPKRSQLEQWNRALTEFLYQ